MIFKLKYKILTGSKLQLHFNSYIWKVFTVDNKLMDRIDRLHQVNLSHKEKSLLLTNCCEHKNINI